MSGTIRIIGIDPGLNVTGWGVIAISGARLIHIDSGAIRPPRSAPLAARLRAIHDGLLDILAQYAPDAAAVEETFVNKDARATLKLGQARGVAMLTPAMRGLEVAEYAPNAVKKTVVGTGHAQKEQVAAMVKVLLPKARPATADAADALAVAICHAHHLQSFNRLTAS